MTLLRRERGAKRIMMHHRMPTSTDNVYNACHPISTRSETGNVLEHTYIGMHNGWINNDKDLKKIHEGLGIKYVTQQSNGKFNDSESLIWDLALAFEGKKTFEAKGNMAWIVMELDETGKAIKLHFGRNSTKPLKIHRKDHKYLTLSSEGPGTDALVDTHYIFDYETQEYERIDFPMPTYNWDKENKSAAPFHGRHGHTTSDIDYTGDRSVLVPALANTAYKNGHMDATGRFIPKVEMGFPTPTPRSTGTTAQGTRKTSMTSMDVDKMFTEEEKSAFWFMVENKVISDTVSAMLNAAKGDVGSAWRVALGQRAKQAHKVRNLRMQLQWKGPLFMEHETFVNLDQTLFGAETQLYILHKVVEDLFNMTPRSLLTIEDAQKKAAEEAQEVAVSGGKKE